MTRKNKINISQELIIQRCKKGVQLVERTPKEENLKCDSALLPPQYSIADYLDTKFSFYIHDMQDILHLANEPLAEMVDASSPKRLLGHSADYAFSKEVSSNFLETAYSIVESSETKILDEFTLLRKDGSPLHIFSVKSPLYDQKNNLIGILGCSIAVGRQPLSEALHDMVRLGILNWLEPFPEKILFSRREQQCLYFLVLGKTAKEISKILGLEPKTIEYYIENMKIKIGANSRSTLIEKAIQLNYISIKSNFPINPLKTDTSQAQRTT